MYNESQKYLLETTTIEDLDQKHIKESTPDLMEGFDQGHHMTFKNIEDVDKFQCEVSHCKESARHAVMVDGEKRFVCVNHLGE